MKKISLILFLCIIAFSILRAEDKSVIKLIPVYEKTFQDTIVDVIFDTATVSISEAKAMGWKEEAFNEEEKRIGKGEIFYTKVVILKKGKRKLLNFFNSKGILKKSFKTGDYAEVIISQNDKYIGITTPGEHESNFQMVDIYGNILWKITGLGTGPYIPSPDGKYCLGEASIEVENAPVSIYNKRGLVIKVKKSFAGFWTGFSSDMKLISIGIPMKFPRGKIIIFDNNFKILKEDTMAVVFGDVGGGNYISFSPNKKYVVYPILTGGIEILNLIDKESCKVQFQGKGNYKYIFTEDGNNLLVTDTKGSCFFIDIKNKKILWKNKVESGDFGSVMVNRDFSKIFVCVYPNKIRLINKKGSLILKKELKDFNFHYIPRFDVSLKGNKVIFADVTGKVRCLILKRNNL